MRYKVVSAYEDTRRYLLDPIDARPEVAGSLFDFRGAIVVVES